MIPLFDITRQYSKIKSEIIEAIDNVISKGRVILGQEVERLEQNIANFIGVKFGIGVANGSDALVIALKAMGIKEGEKVITTPYTFFATASAIVRNGGIPIFVDVDSETYNIDLNQVEDILKKEKVFGIIPVHLFGQTVDLEGLYYLKEKYGIKILEDCAQSIGSEGILNGQVKKSGSIGDAAIFSFFPTKNLGAYGDGGMIVTDDERIYEKAKMLRVHGAKKKYFHEEIGFNSRLDEIQASLLNVKLKHYNELRKQREKIANRYLSEIINPRIEIPEIRKGSDHVWHLFEIRTAERDKLQAYLKNNGIGTQIHYPIPPHLSEAYEYLGYKKGDFPKTEKLADTLLSLPIYDGMKDEEIDYVIKIINEYES